MIRRFSFLLFGILDIVLAIRFGPSEFEQFGGLSHATFPAALLLFSRLLFLASLVVSAVGLFLGKNWALIVTYIQFPFRFVFMLLSFGFISELARVFAMPGLYRPLIYAAMILECARLVCSVWIHRKPLHTALELL